MSAQEQTVEALLAELEAERARLDFMIADIRRRLGRPNEPGGNAIPGLGAHPTVGQSSPGSIRPDEFFQMSIPEAIKRYLAIMKSPQSPKAIAAALRAGGLISEAKNFYTTVYTAIKRLRDAGEIVNVRKGWGLSEWYKGRTLANAKETKKRKRSKRKKGGTKRGTSAPRRPAPKHEPSPPPKPQTYAQFVGERMRSGKTMKEAAAEWKKQKAAQ